MEKNKENQISNKNSPFFDEADPFFKLWRVPTKEQLTQIKKKPVLAKSVFHKKGKRFGFVTSRCYFLCQDYLYYKKVRN